MPEHSAPATMKDWMARFAEASRSGNTTETSAGAGPGRDYAYLHFRTRDGEHSILVLRLAFVDGEPEVRAYEFNARPEELRDLVFATTHTPPPRR
jgi:hypothetical protein